MDERTKYRKAWATDAYQRYSPGLLAAPEAMEWYRSTGCASLTDFGCGDGRAMRWFGAHGVPVVGVDLMGDTVGAVGAVEVDLSNLPDELPVTDFAFSCDVLEHLPTEGVLPALGGMLRHTNIAGYVQVFTRPDGVGDTIGETLHLTVRPAAWWREQIEQAGWTVHKQTGRGRATFWLTA